MKTKDRKWSSNKKVPQVWKPSEAQSEDHPMVLGQVPVHFSNNPYQDESKRNDESVSEAHMSLPKT